MPKNERVKPTKENCWKMRKHGVATYDQGCWGCPNIWVCALRLKEKPEPHGGLYEE